MVALSGNMLWFALSGMETVAFLSLGILALLVYRGERWVLLGILLGLVILMRPEGIALAAAVGIIDVSRKRRISRDILMSAIICAFVSVPWYAYLYWRTGYLLPNSAVAKMDSFRLGIQVISEKYPLLEPLSGLYPQVYFGFLLGFLVEFVMGGMALPGPRLTFEPVAGIAGFSFSIWAVLLLLGVITPLLIFASKRILTINSWPNWIEKNEYRVLLVFSVWVILHNIGLSVGLPSIGTGGRYAAIVVIPLWMLVVIGLVHYGIRSFYLLVITCAVAAAALFNFLYWNEVHDSNLAYMDNVRIKTAKFICEDFSEDEICAAIDIGVYRYYCDRPIVDLGGLVDPNIVD